MMYLSYIFLLLQLANTISFNNFIIKSVRNKKNSVCKLNNNIINNNNDNKELNLDDIAGRWKLIKYNGGGSDSYYGLEQKDKNYYVKSEKITVKRIGGIGLDLEEVIITDDYRGGVVLIRDIVKESNADKCGQFKIGDTLVSISDDNNNNKLSLEACTYDETLDRLAKFSESESVTITIQRLARRNEITTFIVGPQGEEVGNFTVLSGYGTNLRTVLQSQNLRLYDDRTYRFDSPYQKGNCGGDGTCGTCVVAVLAGKDLLNEKVRVEDKALKKQDAPPNYRWSCRVQLAPDPASKGSIKIKLRPQTAVWDSQQ